MTEPTDYQIMARMDEILATSEDSRERHMAHRTSYYAHRRLMEQRAYENYKPNDLESASLCPAAMNAKGA